MNTLLFKGSLSAKKLQEEVAPFIRALAEIQQLIDQMQGASTKEVVITSIFAEHNESTGASVGDLYTGISKLSVLEASQLTTLLEEKWGVAATSPSKAHAEISTAPNPDPSMTEFAVVLKSVGDKKIDVIKVIRQLTNLGLKEAKDLAETNGALVLNAASQEAADYAKKKLTEVGAIVEIKAD